MTENGVDPDQEDALDLEEAADLAPRDPVEGAPILIFDDQCGLCARIVQALLQKTGEAPVRFCLISQPMGQAVSRVHKVRPRNPDSLIFIEDGATYTHVDAVLRLAAYLDPPWNERADLAAKLPAKLLNWAHGQIAQRRHHWFDRPEGGFQIPAKYEDRFIGV